MNDSSPLMMDDIDQLFSSSCEIKVPPSLAILPGHFANRPLLPAIYSLELARRYLELELAEKIQFDTIIRSKFKSQIVPGTMLQVKVEVLSRSPELAKARVRFYQQDGKIAMDAVFTVSIFR